MDTQPLRGVLLVLMAVFLFAASDTLGKYLVMRYPVSVVMAVRYVVSVGLLLLWLWPKHRQRLWQTQRTFLVFLRGLCLTMASLTMGIALSLMPVGETIAILYLSPFAVMLIAIPLLGEKVSLGHWLSATVAFLGVLLVLRPGGGLDSWGVVMALANAALATAYHLMTKVLSRTETTIAMLFYSSLVGAVIFSVLAFGELADFHPDLMDIGLMILLGAGSTAGHFLFTSAYRHAPASLLAPMNYLHLVWAGLLGWMVFNHIPDHWSLLGMAMVCLSGISLALTAHLNKRRLL